MQRTRSSLAILTASSWHLQRPAVKSVDTAVAMICCALKATLSKRRYRRCSRVTWRGG